MRALPIVASITRTVRGCILLGLLFCLVMPVPAARALPSPPAPSTGGQVRRLKVTILSTMLADAGIGEWGFAALVEADGHPILFDTGARPDTVAENARELGIDLSRVTDVVLSHNHDDHTGGLLSLRRALMKKDPAALSRAHVGTGIFYSRPGKDGERNPLLSTGMRDAYLATGARFIEHDGPAEILPGVWLTGPVPRRHPERNWSGHGQVRTPAGLVEDNLPEDMSLVVVTGPPPATGLVVVTGCGHAGIINTLEHARGRIRDVPVHAVLGGLHLFPASDEHLDWTADRLREMGVIHLLGAHCTGIEAVYHIRRRAGLSRATCVVGAVGATYELGKGIDPRLVAR